MAQYKTPGVYIEEVNSFPGSIAAVETAVPAFIGYTQKTVCDGIDNTYKCVLISSLLDKGADIICSHQSQLKREQVKMILGGILAILIFLIIF